MLDRPRSELAESLRREDSTPYHQYRAVGGKSVNVPRRPLEGDRGGQPGDAAEDRPRRAFATSTIDRLNADLKEAMKARDAERTSTLRMAISALKYRTIERNAQLSEDEQIDVLRKQVKQRDDSIDEFKKAGRDDLVAKESREREILQTYLPARMSGDALQSAVKNALAPLGADAKFGDAMKAAMAALKDQADGKAIQEAVKAELAARASS